MALPVCALCGENEAAQMITNFETGDSLAICKDCFPSFVLGLAEQMMEAGMIELPEAEQPEATATSDDDGLAPNVAEALARKPQDVQDAVTEGASTLATPKAKRATRTTTAANGRSPEGSIEVPTATVDEAAAETAESPASATAN